MMLLSNKFDIFEVIFLFNEFGTANNLFDEFWLDIFESVVGLGDAVLDRIRGVMANDVAEIIGEI